MVIDSHEHIMFPVKMQLDKMDAAGVDKTVLFCTAPHPEKAGTLKELEEEMAALNKILAGANSKEDNIRRLKKNISEVVEAVREYPERFLGFGSVPLGMGLEVPKEVFSRKQQEVGEKIAELEQRMAQYGDVEPATEADVSGKLENLQRLMGQFTMPEDGEFSEEEMDKYVSGVRVYEDRFEWLLNLSPDAGGGLDDAGSPVYFKKITVTPDDERAWFRKHPQWSKSNRYAELEVWIFI